MMKKLLCLLLLVPCCSVPLFPQIDPCTYEGALISRGDNRPDFDAKDRAIKTLIVSLHLRIPPQEFQATYGWSSEKYLERVRFLISKNYAYEKGGRFYPSCMVVTDREGKELFRYAEPLSQAIANAIIAHLDTIKSQYQKTDLCRTTAFPEVAFLILSNVLLDNWQISNVETQFLAKERPLRHGKNYCVALLENLNPSRESFSMYGNMGSKDVSVYGNNRKALSAGQIQEQSKAALVISTNDDDIFNRMASSFRPVLIDLLNKDRGYLEEVYKKTGYSQEVSFGSFSSGGITSFTRGQLTSWPKGVI